MTKKELRTDLLETVTKIRSTQESLKALRTHHTDLKARLTLARAAKKGHGAS